MINKRTIYAYIIIIISLIIHSCVNNPPDIPPNKVVPSKQQIEYQKMELIGFVHFSINTFTDKEWGYGDESPDVFNPTALNTDQWAEVAKEAGMGQLILTAKHHDGFCLWPSKYTEHSVKNNPWKDGGRDVVGEFVNSCRKYGLKAGLYLSPWDRNHAEYGYQAYVTYYREQLRELLTQYGEISEIWFDGANGGTGYYGGADEERRIDRTSYYQWDEIFSYVKDLQTDILIFSDAGPDIRWIGNENGFAGKTNWSMINTENIVIGTADTEHLNSGDPQGEKWVVGECDVSIRPGWFYHPYEDSLVKTPQELVDIYYKSVGRNAVLLLNIPPDTRGLFHEEDINSLKEFRNIINETFRNNLAQGKNITASNYRLKHKKFSPSNVLDNDNRTYWAADDTLSEVWLEIDLEEEVVFDRIMIQEPIRFGQRISEFTVECYIKDTWVTIARGTTVGYKRLLRVQPIKALKVRLNIIKFNNTPAVSSFGIYKASKLDRKIYSVYINKVIQK